MDYLILSMGCSQQGIQCTNYPLFLVNSVNLPIIDLPHLILVRLNFLLQQDRRHFQKYSLRWCRPWRFRVVQSLLGAVFCTLSRYSELFSGPIVFAFSCQWTYDWSHPGQTWSAHCATCHNYRSHLQFVSVLSLWGRSLPINT